MSVPAMPPRVAVDLFLAAADSVKPAPGMHPVVELHRPGSSGGENSVVVRFLDLPVETSRDDLAVILGYEAELLVAILYRLAGADMHLEMYRAYQRWLAVARGEANAVEEG